MPGIWMSSNLLTVVVSKITGWMENSVDSDQTEKTVAYLKWVYSIWAKSTLLPVDVSKFAGRFHILLCLSIQCRLWSDREDWHIWNGSTVYEQNPIYYLLMYQKLLEDCHSALPDLNLQCRSCEIRKEQNVALDLGLHYLNKSILLPVDASKTCWKWQCTARWQSRMRHLIWVYTNWTSPFNYLLMCPKVAGRVTVYVDQDQMAE